MTVRWEGKGEVVMAARRAARELVELEAGAVGETLRIANEFTEVVVQRVDTPRSPRSGQWVTLDALEGESLTWQNDRTLAAMVGNMYAPLLPDQDSAR
ncbi:dihydrodiol dehydrogenase [Mycobacterium kansasii]|nr:dihydrodiol dehydrogenase [Mycobacterium kansasii]POY25813.1 dihydrodiol dehydrogenase [Mycobacterium kansasii]POY32975.1 dihydrodiol dehydrogenase [Mycobacterium kansasii]